MPDLRTGIEGRTCLGFSEVAIGYDFGNIQVSDFVGTVGGSEDVGRLDISMNDVVFVQKFQPCNQEKEYLLTLAAVPAK